MLNLCHTGEFFEKDLQDKFLHISFRNIDRNDHEVPSFILKMVVNNRFAFYRTQCLTCPVNGKKNSSITIDYVALGKSYSSSNVVTCTRTDNANFSSPRKWYVQLKKRVQLTEDELENIYWLLLSTCINTWPAFSNSGRQAHAPPNTHEFDMKLWKFYFLFHQQLPLLLHTRCFIGDHWKHWMQSQLIKSLTSTTQVSIGTVVCCPICENKTTTDEETKWKSLEKLKALTSHCPMWPHWFSVQFPKIQMSKLQSLLLWLALLALVF